MAVSMSPGRCGPDQVDTNELVKAAALQDALSSISVTITTRFAATECPEPAAIAEYFLRACLGYVATLHLLRARVVASFRMQAQKIYHDHNWRSIPKLLCRFVLAYAGLLLSAVLLPFSDTGSAARWQRWTLNFAVSFIDSGVRR